MKDGSEAIWGIVPGRMDSERLPGKTMANICGAPSLVHIVRRLKQVPGLQGVVVATTVAPADEVIRDAALLESVEVYRGSPNDVLARTLEAARSVDADAVVNITGDCPLVDARLVERMIALYRDQQPDMVTNRLGGYHFPIGLDVEVFPVSRLAEVEAKAHDPRDREHVTLWWYEHAHELNIIHVDPEPHQRRPALRLTLDEQNDLRVIREIYRVLGDNGAYFGLDDVLAFLDANPHVAEWNESVIQRVP